MIPLLSKNHHMMDVSQYSILLVEDDSNDIFLIQRAFRKASLVNSLQVVQDGDEAIYYLAGENSYQDRNQHPLPGLILLDLKLPRRSGLEVLEWIRSQPILKRIPVVVLSSSRENTDIDRAYDLGVNSYLVKPVSFDALISIVKVLDAYWLKLNHYPSIKPL